MKRIIFAIALLFAVGAAKAQTVSWNPIYTSTTSGTFTATSTSTSYTFDSNLLYAHFSLGPDGHTIFYHVTAKNIPHNPGNLMAEFQTNIGYDGWPGIIYASKQALWNVSPGSGYGSDWDYESYPTTSEYSYEGSFDLNTTEEVPLWIYAGIMYWDEADFFQDATVNLYPTITP